MLNAIEISSKSGLVRISFSFVLFYSICFARGLAKCRFRGIWCAWNIYNKILSYLYFLPYFYAILWLIIYYLCLIGDKGFTCKVELSQLLTQLEGLGGHEVKKRKATWAKQVERKLKKGGPGLLIQSQHEKNKDLETRGVEEKEIKKITIEVLLWVKEIYSGLGVLISLC